MLPILLHDSLQPLDGLLYLRFVHLDVVSDVLVGLHVETALVPQLLPVLELLPLLRQLPEQELQSQLIVDVTVPLQVDLQQPKVVKLDLGTAQETRVDLQVLYRTPSEVADVYLRLPVLLKV